MSKVIDATHYMYWSNYYKWCNDWKIKSRQKAVQRSRKWEHRIDKLMNANQFLGHLCNVAFLHWEGRNNNSYTFCICKNLKCIFRHQLWGAIVSWKGHGLLLRVSSDISIFMCLWLQLPCVLKAWFENIALTYMRWIMT